MLDSLPSPIHAVPLRWINPGPLGLILLIDLLLSSSSSPSSSDLSHEEVEGEGGDGGTRMMNGRRGEWEDELPKDDDKVLDGSRMRRRTLGWRGSNHRGSPVSLFPC